MADLSAGMQIGILGQIKPHLQARCYFPIEMHWSLIFEPAIITPVKWRQG